MFMKITPSKGLNSCGKLASGWKAIQLVHPGRLTWNLQITHLERKMIFQTSMIMFHVNLQGCRNSFSPIIFAEDLKWHFFFSLFAQDSLKINHSHQRLWCLGGTLPNRWKYHSFISYHIYSQHEAMLGNLVLFSYCIFFLGGLATSKSDALRCLFTGISLHDLGTEREGVEPWYVGVHVSGWATFPTMLFFLSVVSQCLNLWLVNLHSQLTFPQI